MHPSPARAEPHDAESWLPLPDVAALPELDDELIATSTGPAEARSTPPGVDAPPPPSPARARPHDASTWLPLPVPDQLPSIEDMLTTAPWEPRPSPPRAEPHDAAAWLPLPDVGTLAPVAPVTTSAETPTLTVPDADAPPLELVPAPAGVKGQDRPATLATGHPARWKVAFVGLLVLATVVAGALAWNGLAHQGSSVEIRVDGRRTSVDSGAATVGKLLRDQGVQLGLYDRVVPGRSAALRDGLTVTVLRAFPITRDLDGTIQTVHTTYASPTDYLRRDLRATDSVVIRSAPQRLETDSTIILRTRHSGQIQVDGATVDFAIPALDVNELLAQYSVDLGPDDYVTNRAGQPLTIEAHLVDGEQYTVVRVGRELERNSEEYTVPDEQRPDPTMNVGETRAVAGTPGTMTVTYEVTRQNGAEVDRKTVSRVPAVAATPNITYYGTKADPVWDRIAQCETNGNWAMRGDQFSGGLGFYNGTWDQYGGREFAPNAGLATREQQIIVAERIRAGVGIGGWGCAHVLGYVR